jgi:hypothetical protein
MKGFKLGVNASAASESDDVIEKSTKQQCHLCSFFSLCRVGIDARQISCWSRDLRNGYMHFQARLGETKQGYAGAWDNVAATVTNLSTSSGA